MFRLLNNLNPYGKKGNSKTRNVGGISTASTALHEADMEQKELSNNTPSINVKG